MRSRDMLRKYLPASLKQDIKRRLISFSEQVKARTSAGYTYADWLLTPNEMRQAVRHYDAAATASAREGIVRRLLDRISVNPAYTQLLASRYFTSQFGTHPLLLQARAASDFRCGNFPAAVAGFEAALGRDPSRLSHFFLAASSRWAGMDCDAVVALARRGLADHPGDVSLALFAATTLFLSDRTVAANDQLAAIRPQLQTLVSTQHPFLADMERELREALAGGIEQRTKGFYKDAYDEDNIRDTYWEDYWCEMTALGPTQFGRAYTSNTLQTRIADALNSLVPAPTTVVNFGCLCADADYRLAQRFPQIAFIGVDRESATAKLNGQAYSAGNLSFVAADILEALPRIVAESRGPVLLAHARTVNLILPAWVRQFYRQCHQLGVQYVIGYENGSLSKTQLAYFDFESMPQDTLVFQNGQYLHNYARYVGEAGYDVGQVRRSQEVVLHSAHDGLHLADSHVSFLARKR